MAERGAGKCIRLSNTSAIFNSGEAGGLRQWQLPDDQDDVGWELGVMLTLMLVCAVAASLGAGVLLAYGICLAMFRLFRIHATQVAARRVAPAAGLRVARN